MTDNERLRDIQRQNDIILQALKGILANQMAMNGSLDVISDVLQRPAGTEMVDTLRAVVAKIDALPAAVVRQLREC